MKVFFDSNVFVAEALLGKGAEKIIFATQRAKWRIYASQYIVDEVGHVLVDYLDFPKKLAVLTQLRITRRFPLIIPQSKAIVPDDPKDSPVLQAALTCAADYLVTNDRHLLALNPFESLRILSMDNYYALLKQEGLLK